jgi:hypothetical protein
MFIPSLNYFRGIAILAIVAGHCIPLSGWGESRFLERAMANVVLGGTSLFVFISGFFFHHVFYQKFDYFRFLRKKVSKILVPYLTLSLIAIFFVFQAGSLPYAQYFAFSDEPGVFSRYVKPALLYLWTGRVLVGYWYIPFIMITFALAPFHVWIINASRNTQLLIFSVSLGISMLIHRPIDNMSVLQSVAYFSPVYVFGIICSVHKETVYGYLKQKEIYLAAGVLLLAALEAAFYEKYGSLHKEAFVYGGVDLQILQKLFLCLFLMIFLERFETTNIAPLKHLASASFAIFFLHPWLTAFIPGDPEKYGVHWSWPVLWPILTVGVTLTSIFLAFLIRYVLKSRSKYVIGW